MQLNLNERAYRRCRLLLEDSCAYRVTVSHTRSGTCLVDCGVEAVGGLEAGRLVAEVCLAGLGTVSLLSPSSEAPGIPLVSVYTDHPVAACLGSQYAGWRIAGQDFFAMGSGPMRAAYGEEVFFDGLVPREAATVAVGVLEGDRLPHEDICLTLAAQCRVPPDSLVLLVAKTSSLVGSVQVAARSVETALHKLHQLGFDLQTIRSAWGTAPLAPPAANDLEAIGRTNDSVLYGAEVTLWLAADDSQIEQIGPQTPSEASRDYGRPFLETFRSYDCDFYRVDPLLFSPAVVHFCNISTGRCFSYGRKNWQILNQSFR
ncbi:MAG: methenyltetrahydromethanopterin cyclohydrolase [Pirellulaceae bacterium]|nr:MAG: methenyltetrahydromethanopterin cyclohydrolase [Pirellulaceae bacterium]